MRPLVEAPWDIDPVGVAATAFATVLNGGPTTASGGRLAPLTNVPASFAFQITNPPTNEVTGMPNTAIDIPPGPFGPSFLFAFVPCTPFSTTEVAISFACASGESAAVIAGLKYVAAVGADRGKGEPGRRAPPT